MPSGRKHLVLNSIYEDVIYIYIYTPIAKSAKADLVRESVTNCCRQKDYRIDAGSDISCDVARMSTEI